MTVECKLVEKLCPWEKKEEEKYGICQIKTMKFSIESMSKVKKWQKTKKERNEDIINENRICAMFFQFFAEHLLPGIFEYPNRIDSV